MAQRGGGPMTASLEKGARAPHGPMISDDVGVHRQIDPKRWLEHEGRPSSDVFRPRKCDHGLLSLTDGRKRDAAESWAFYHSQGTFKSAGVLTLPAGVFASEGGQVHEDPLLLSRDGQDDDAHACADFREKSPSKGVRKRLLLQAGAPTYLATE